MRKRETIKLKARTKKIKNSYFINNKEERAKEE